MKVITIENFNDQTSDTDVYFRDFLRALLMVTKDYYETYRTKDVSKWNKKLERIFAYEFYHQIRNIMEESKDPKKSKDLKRYENIFLNGEPHKDPFCYTSLSVDSYPDLIMHEYTEKGKLGEQCWLCEIKMTPVRLSGTKKDLRNLTGNYVLNFKHYIFLIVGETLDRLTDLLKNIPFKWNPDIECVCYCNGKIEYAKLGALYKEIEEKNKNLKC